MNVYNETLPVGSDDPELTSVAAKMPSLLLLLHQSISPSAAPLPPTTILTVATASGDSDFLLRQQINWYMIIVILSALVLVGMCFTICRLVMKATAHEKAGLDWPTGSLLFSRKDSIIPISLHFDQNYDNDP